MRGRCTEGAQKVRGRCAEGVREVRGRCAGGERKVCRRCAGGAHEVRGRCNANDLIGCCGDLWPMRFILVVQKGFFDWPT